MIYSFNLRVFLDDLRGFPYIPIFGNKSRRDMLSTCEYENMFLPKKKMQTLEAKFLRYLRFLCFDHSTIKNIEKHLNTLEKYRGQTTKLILLSKCVHSTYNYLHSGRQEN